MFLVFPSKNMKFLMLSRQLICHATAFGEVLSPDVHFGSSATAHSKRLEHFEKFRSSLITSLNAFSTLRSLQA